MAIIYHSQMQRSLAIVVLGVDFGSFGQAAVPPRRSGHSVLPTAKRPAVVVLGLEPSALLASRRQPRFYSPLDAGRPAVVIVLDTRRGVSSEQRLPLFPRRHA